MFLWIMNLVDVDFVDFADVDVDVDVSNLILLNDLFFYKTVILCLPSCWLFII